MFKSKRKIIKELKAELEEKESIIAPLQANCIKRDEELVEAKREIERLKTRLEDYIGLDDATPSDCKRGKWCAGCEFAKMVFAADGFVVKEVYFCGKGESCQNFVKRTDL